ncbi:MAG: hypothetical protein MK215_05890 [Candidatus Poseidoniia archaeon]|nr:hypothetical protein [Candidatus Poseidoniia archaeon]
MQTIKVSKSEIETGWIFEVKVSNGNSTTHRVNLTREYYEHLPLSDTTPTKLVEGSFRFLLEREPKEMILRTFDLKIISHYFPEYERRISEYI